MSSIQKRKLENFLSEEIPIHKKLNTQESLINLHKNDKANESPNASTMTTSPNDQIITENQLKQHETPVRNTTGPKKQEKSSYEEIHKAYLSDPSSFVDTYKVVKYKGNIYHIEDKLLIRNEADANSDFICKLLRIIRPLKETLKMLAFLEVQW